VIVVEERPAAERVAENVTDLLRDLGQQLGELHGRLKQLTEIAGAKLAALRRADTAALTQCAADEESLLRQNLGGEPQHKALLARVAQALRHPQPQRATLMEVAERCPEPATSVLRARSEALRQTATELRRKNALVAEVARKLQMHLRGVVADLAGVSPDAALYGPHGEQAGGRIRRYLDAVV
jgi:ABC-type transporter Mla subunit MlaD